jgi:hypothetical protein
MNLFAAMLSVNLLAAAPPVYTAQTVDGRQIQGALIGWTKQRLVLRSGNREEQLLLDQLLSVTPSKASPPGQTADTAWVTLTDGTTLAARSYMAGPEKSTATTNRAGRLNLPAASVHHVRFRAAPPGMQKRWEEILNKETDQDMLVIGAGDTLDFLDGIVRSVREQEIDFDLDGELVPVKKSKVFAIRYYRPNRPETPKPLGRLMDDDGSVWPLQRVSLAASEDQLACETPLGLQVAMPLAAVSRIDFAGAGLVFLSNVTADSYQWTPYFGSAESVPSLAKLYRPRMNTTFDSSPIVLDGIQYEHGLTLHSRTEMTYRLTEPFERFQANAGIDDRLRPRGNVELKILGDDRVLFHATVAGTAPAQPIDVSLKGVTTLTILADFGSDLDVGDHLILAEAKLLK